MIRDLTIFIPPLPQGEGRGEGSHGKVYQVFGDELSTFIEQLN